MAKKTDRSSEAEILELTNELQELGERYSALKEKNDSLQAEHLRTVAENARLTTRVLNLEKDFDNLRNSMV